MSTAGRVFVPRSPGDSNGLHTTGPTQRWPTQRWLQTSGSAAAVAVALASRLATGPTKSTSAAAFVSARRNSLSRPSASARKADIGDVDYAIIRFKVPGFDDLSQLPRFISGMGVLLLIANHVLFPDETGLKTRLVTELLAVVLAAGCWSLPWLANRLEEAARRQVSTRQASRQLGAMQTLAIEDSLEQQARLDVAWATSVLLRLTNADGLAVWRGSSSGGTVVCTRGLLRQLPGFSDGPEAVLQALSSAWTPTTYSGLDGYCATRSGLESFPSGALPLSVLPGDTESVVMKPLLGGGLLVLWSAIPRAFDRTADRNWVGRVAAKLGAVLPAGVGEPAPMQTEQCFEEDLLGGSEEGAKSRDPFARFDSQIRIAPAIVGLSALGVLGWNRITLVNAILMDIDPAQSRADLVGGTLATTLLMQGMIWLSETPATPKIEDTSKWLDAEEVVAVSSGLSQTMADELRWAWESLSICTRVCSMAVFWDDVLVMQGGLFQPLNAGGIRPELGPLCREVMRTGRGRYLPQLPNYPAKDEFLDFLPARTRALVLTPLRPGRDAPAQGVLVLGLDAIRGVGKIDQAWVGALGEKIAVGMAEYVRELKASEAMA